MSAADEPHQNSEAQDRTNDARLTALEREIVVLKAELAALRGPDAKGASGERAGSPYLSASLAKALEQVPRDTVGGASARGRASFADRMHANATISGEELESFVGKYVAVALGGLVMLMAVGAMIRMAVQHGLLTPEVRVTAGLVAAPALAGGGVFFSRR